MSYFQMLINPIKMLLKKNMVTLHLQQSNWAIPCCLMT